MKIFDWMHRKLHPNVDYCMVSRKRDPLRFADYEKKQSTVTCETAALLSDHVTLVDALDGWQDGILTIGTFGLDHHLKKHTEYSAHEEYSFAAPYEAISDNDGEEEPEEQEAEEQDAELHPLAISAFKQELEQVFGTNPRAESQILKPDAAALTNDGEDNLLRRFLGDLAFNGEDEAEKEKKKKGERTTLADLFSADARAMGAPALTVAGKCGGSARALPEPGKKTACRAKNVRSLAKKLITWKGEESRPTRKIQRLVKKMLKRKIHPDLERDTHGTGGSFGGVKIDHSVISKPALESDSSSSNNNSTGNESISLLHDAVVEL